MHEVFSCFQSIFTSANHRRDGDRSLVTSTGAQPHICSTSPPSFWHPGRKPHYPSLWLQHRPKYPRDKNSFLPRSRQSHRPRSSSSSSQDHQDHHPQTCAAGRGSARDRVARRGGRFPAHAARVRRPSSAASLAADARHAASTAAAANGTDAAAAAGQAPWGKRCFGSASVPTGCFSTSAPDKNRASLHTGQRLSADYCTWHRCVASHHHICPLCCCCCFSTRVEFCCHIWPCGWRYTCAAFRRGKC